MRHLLSIVLSIILAPVIYVAAGLAAVKLDASHITITSIDWTAAEIGLAAGVVAGVLYAVLVMARLSPIGPAIAGLLYLGVTIWSFLNSASFTKALDFDLAGVHHVLLQPVGFGTLLLAMPLLGTLFSRRRWTPGPVAGLPYDAAPAYSSMPPSAAPAYGEAPTLVSPTYGAPYPGEPAGYTSEPASYSPEPPVVYQPPVSTSPVYTPTSSAPSSPYTPANFGQPDPSEPSPMDTWPTSYSPEQRSTDQ